VEIVVIITLLSLTIFIISIAFYIFLQDRIEIYKNRKYIDTRTFGESELNLGKDNDWVRTQQKAGYTIQRQELTTNFGKTQKEYVLVKNKSHLERLQDTWSKRSIRWLFIYLFLIITLCSLTTVLSSNTVSKIIYDITSTSAVELTNVQATANSYLTATQSLLQTQTRSEQRTAQASATSAQATLFVQGTIVQSTANIQSTLNIRNTATQAMFATQTDIAQQTVQVQQTSQAQATLTFEATYNAQSTQRAQLTFIAQETLNVQTTRQAQATAYAQATIIAMTPTALPYRTTTGANVRACAETTCQLRGSIRSGETVYVFQAVTGENVNGSTIWYRIEYNGSPGYIHSSTARR